MMGCASVRNVFYTQLRANERNRVVHLEEDPVPALPWQLGTTTAALDNPT